MNTPSNIIYTFSHTHGWLTSLSDDIPLLNQTQILDIGLASAKNLQKGYSIYEFMQLLVHNIPTISFSQHNKNALFYTSIIACGRRVLWPDCHSTSKHLKHYSITDITTLLSSRRVRIYHIFNKIHHDTPSPQIKIKFGYLKFSPLSHAHRSTLTNHLVQPSANHDNTSYSIDLSKLLSLHSSQYVETVGGTLYPANTIIKMLS